MTEDNTKQERQKALFANLVMMLASSTMQQMGKLVNPMTNKTEVNLEGAQVTIDMLEMLDDRIKSDLDEDEAKMLADILASLQMNYVQTARDTQAAGPADKTDAEKEEAPPADQPPPEEKTEEPKSSEQKEQEEQKDPKYHKSYGE